MSFSRPDRPGSPASPSRSVRRLGDYHLLQKLGQGGMGAVYLAKRIGVGGFEKTFVVKCMLESLAGSPELITMFFDEARLAARLAHPNIAQIYDFGVIDGTYYIAMEHIAGEDLSTIIRTLHDKNVRIPVPVGLRIMLELCAGLDYAHHLSDGDRPLGIIHRDVSPSNVMVSYQGVVKLLDFGVAKTTLRLGETQSGGIKGKLSYLAPEQLQDLPIDARVDIFSMGITLFKLLTHKHPFQRGTEIATMQAILTDPPLDARRLRDNLPDSVVAIILKALAREREARFQSAAEMATALKAALDPGGGTPDLAGFMVTLFGREAVARRSHVPTLGEVNLAEVVSPSLKITSSVPVLGPVGGMEPATTLEVPAFRPAARARRRVLWVAAAAALGAAAGLVGVALRRSAPRPPVALTSAAPASATRPPVVRPVVAAVTTPAPPSVIRSAEPAPHRLRPRSPPSEPARLDGEALQAVVTRAQPRFVACFRGHADELPAAAGQATVELTVDSTGKVASALARVPEPAPALRRCLEVEALRLHFPRHADREIRFAFPLVYRKGQ